MAQTKIKAGLFEGIIGNGTDGYFLMSNGDGTMTWSSIIINPTVSSIAYPGSVTAADPAGGETITVTGTGFKTGATVTIGGTAAPAVSYVSETQITFTTPAKAAGDYDIVVTNTDTGSATFINGISYNGIPTWTTAAGSLGTFASDTTISTITLQATEPDAGTITFSITNGALPTGLSLTGANIDGTTALETADTLYTFTVTATDDESQATPRTFTITVEKAPPLNTDNFAPALYSGNGSTQSINAGFAADLVFIKNRTVGQGWSVWDTVRGASSGYLQTQVTSAESPQQNMLTFDSEGFNVSTNGGGYTQTNRNSSGDQYVSFSWKADGSAASNTDGSITSQVSANQGAGFSIIEYTGTGNASATVGHGLSAKPELVIVKGSSWASSWATHFEIGSNYYWGYLDNTARTTNSGSQVAPISNTTFTTAHVGTNNNNQTFIAYCFHSVAGYQKIGTYTGTGTNLNTINVGFQPRFVLFKRTDSGSSSWRIFDSIRGTDKSIRLDLDDAEYDDTQNYVDFTSNGFEFNRTVSQSNSDLNASGGTYVYLAIA